MIVITVGAGARDRAFTTDCFALGALVSDRLALFTKAFICVDLKTFAALLAYTRATALAYALLAQPRGRVWRKTFPAATDMSLALSAAFINKGAFVASGCGR
jgi:hypothetical protein